MNANDQKFEKARNAIDRGFEDFNNKNYERALKSFDNALKMFKSNKNLKRDQGRVLYANALFGKSATLSFLGKYKEALKSLDKTLEMITKLLDESPELCDTLDDRRATALSYKGYDLYNLRRYKEALESFDKALELNPEYVDALFGKSATLKNLGRFKEAIEFCERALC